MILIVVNARTRRDEKQPAPSAVALASILNSPSHHSLLSTSALALESHKHWQPQAAAQEQAQLAERVPELEQSTSPESTPGNIDLQGASSSWRLTLWKATKRRDCGREKLMLRSFSRLWMSQLLGSQCLHLTVHQETSASPQAVPENLIFLLMIHLPPHCIKDIKWVS